MDKIVWTVIGTALLVLFVQGVTAYGMFKVYNKINPDIADYTDQVNNFDK